MAHRYDSNSKEEIAALLLLFAHVMRFALGTTAIMVAAGSAGFGIGV